MNKTKYIVQQLIYHLPFSVFGVMLALLALGFLTFITMIVQSEHILPEASGELFHVFHAAHVLLSAVASTAMFYKHDQKIWKALLIGFVGSIVICGISDILFPFMGGILIGSEMHLHICIIEEPQVVYPFAVIGTIAGLAAPKSFERATEYSHSMHVFVSSVASILYLIAFGLEHWLHAIGAVFAITVVAVMIPCCLSDIAFPLACSHSNCTHPEIFED